MPKTKYVIAIVGGAAILGLGMASIFSRPPYTVVVLGSNSKLHALLRVDGARWVADHYNVKRMIFTGGSPHGTLDGKTEADFMADAYGQARFPVLRENKATSTASNISNVAKLLVPGEKVIVVSNHDHVRSAAWCFEHVYGHPSLFVYWPGYAWSATGHKTSGDPTVQQVFSTQQSQNLCKRAGCC